MSSHPSTYLNTSERFGLHIFAHSPSCHKSQPGFVLLAAPPAETLPLLHSIKTQRALHNDEFRQKGWAQL